MTGGWTINKVVAVKVRLAPGVNLNPEVAQFFPDVLAFLWQVDQKSAPSHPILSVKEGMTSSIQIDTARNDYKVCIELVKETDPDAFGKYAPATEEDKERIILSMRLQYDALTYSWMLLDAWLGPLSR